MATKQQDAERSVNRSEQQGLEAIIARHVLDLLGRPETAHWARVRHLWDGHYRVNVLMGDETTFAEIAHSYFLTCDTAGAILTSSPAIKKLY